MYADRPERTKAENVLCKVQPGQENRTKNRYGYYPFGLTFNSYQREGGLENKFKYNGKEEQEEWGVIDYGARMYDASLGRWGVIDKRSHNYMMYSPYNYVANNPINNIDYNGEFILPKEFLIKYERAAQYLANDIQGLLNNKKIVNALKKFGGFTDEQLKTAFTWGQGPVIHPGDYKQQEGMGFTTGWPGSVMMGVSVDLFEALEKAEGKDRDYILFLFAVTVLHEFVHYGEIDNNHDQWPLEAGYEFEREVYGQVFSNKEQVKEYMDDWLKKYNEQKEKESKNKQESFNKLINNFASLEEGTYTWDGSAFVKQ